MGIGSLWLAFADLRDFKKREGDFSEWVVSDATKVTRWLWRANAWARIVVLFLAGFMLFGAAIWMMIR
jgi:hypothetical protein